MAVIFLYQIFVGYLYYRIALLISALMLGMALGILIGRKVRSLYMPHLSIAVFCAIIPFVVGRLASEAVIILFAVISGLICAAIFPIANRLHAGGGTGAVYSADLFGACLGALLPSLILIPVFGVYHALAFVALINLAVMILLIRNHA
jgi:hypothetical protein